MPTYLYKCETHGEFEEEHSIKIKLEFCPKCEANGNSNVPVVRLINCVSVGKVELTGQEYKEKVMSDAASLKREAYRNENVMANLVGESKYHRSRSSR